MSADATQSNVSALLSRMVRAARLDSHLYEEVEHDRGATRQAALVVVVTSIAAGIGGGVSLGLAALVVLPLFALAGWALNAWIAYFIGTRLLAGPETHADWGEVARGLGFAASPRVLLILGVVPVLAAVVGLIVGIWVLITTVIAIRAALDFSTGRAIATAVAAWLVQAIVLGIGYALAA